MRYSVVLLILASLCAPALARDPDSNAGIGGIAGCSKDAATAGRLLPFGCANALNLQAMIDNPADLSDALPAAAPVGEPVVRALDRHRNGQAVPLPTASSTEAPGATGAR